MQVNNSDILATADELMQYKNGNVSHKSIVRSLLELAELIVDENMKHANNFRK
tara:strand:+ start:458 stop:616 length:159 start_codon:yes stop_codon:yes gene_type:complete